MLFVTSALGAVGGIPSYSRATVEALSESADVEVLDLDLTGGLARQGLGFARAVAAIARHRPDLVVLGHVGLGPIGLAWRCVGGRYVVIAYGIEVWGLPSRLVYESLRQAHSVWPISSWTATEVLRTAPGSTMGPVLGGNIRERFFQEHEPNTGLFRILFVATPADLPYKGLDVLATAGQCVATERPIEIRVAGSGSASGLLADYVAEHDPAGVIRLLGRVDDDALLAEYRRADVLVLVSRFRRGANPEGEGLGLVALEAAAAGTAAVVGSRGGSVDTVVADQTGFIIEPEAPEELAEVLHRLASDLDETARMGARAREFVANEHSFGAFSRRVQAGLAEAVR
ncbi:glycosyltransferase [Iamia sp.]|uniref:glycosyltransferase n=1 Tax=Iamia sp. TaxID=2722710 RepID=UPI002CA480D6|nr:glycosyltransferase [Iamia sp.]HXH55735.1 glycosyltransferase [Iamia sp.]